MFLRCLATYTALALIIVSPITLHAAPAPLKVLLVGDFEGGTYAAQKPVLKSGLEKYAQVSVTIADPSVFANDNWADGYDAVIHHYCSGGYPLARIVRPHNDGVGAVVMHCTMHQFIGDSAWTNFLGLGSNGHGNWNPVSIHYVDTTHPITRDAVDWVTEGDEMYNNDGGGLQPAAHALATGSQNKSAPVVIMWTNTYGSGRVFGTTMTHTSLVAGNKNFLAILSRGLLWTCGKLDSTHIKIGKCPTASLPRTSNAHATTAVPSASFRIRDGWLTAVAPGLPSQARVDLFAVSGTRIAACRLGDCTGSRGYLARGVSSGAAVVRVSSERFAMNFPVAGMR